jgi:hypothetical protein
MTTRIPLRSVAGAVEHENGMGVGRLCGCELRQQQIHCCGTDDRQHQGEVLADGTSRRS